MATLKIPQTSVEYVKVPVKVDGMTAAEVRADVSVFMAFLTDLDTTVEPADADYVPGDWAPTGSLKARVLVGPGTNAELAPGDYAIWFRGVGGTEKPVRYCGRLRVI